MMLALLLALGPSVSSVAEQPTYRPTDQTGWFPFLIPDLASAATERAEVDLSFLSPEPAGAHGFLRPRGEDLVDDRGVPVRLFGVNLTDYHPLMPKDLAEPAARRLRQLGVNFVRFHYFDWAKAPAGILNDDMQTLNPEKLDQLDWLFFQLKQHGIYVDLNLHVARGLPDPPPGWGWMGKNLDLLHEPWIQSELRYARDLVSHVNPYTKLRYADDPGIAVIELNNENTALSGWHRYASLPDAFRQPLQQRWNQWLRQKHGTTEKLRQSWGGGLTGPELLRNGDLSAGKSEWTYQLGGGNGTLEVVADATAPGGRYLRWDVREPGTAFWHHQLQQADLPVRDGKSYTLTFTGRARAGGSQALDCSVMMQVEPWGVVGRGVTVELTSGGREHQVAFELANPDGRPVRLNLNCNNEAGTFDLAALSLREGTPPALQNGESLEASTVLLADATATGPKTRDYVRFLLDRELDYVGRFRRLLKDDLGAKQIVYCTQVNYGGAAGLVREATTGDAIDCHAYPSHPLRREVDGRTVWAIRNVSMTGEAFPGLTRLALNRVAGKPYFVTEFDLNPPNDFCAQEFPLLAALATYQGWSGVLDYGWYNFGTGPGTDQIKSPWQTVAHSGQIAFMPAAALLFRQGLGRPAERRVTLAVPRETALDLTAADASGWRGPAWPGVGDGAPWTVGTAMQLADGSGPVAASTAVDAPAAARLVSDTGELTFDRATPGAETLQVNAPALRFVSGSVAGRRFDLGDVRLSFGDKLHRDFAQACLVSLDSQPVGMSKRLLFTIASRVESKGAAYTADRSLCQWGEAPTMAEPVPLTLTLPNADWRAQTLDANGCVRGEVLLQGATLTTRAEDATMWYLLTRE
ncbi:MAG: hypothetical protein GW911_25690 [Armatimonadetes bacterium]|nr:hypothetical protein [Armatimonadota bacterium]